MGIGIWRRTDDDRRGKRLRRRRSGAASLEERPLADVDAERAAALDCSAVSGAKITGVPLLLVELLTFDHRSLIINI